MYTPWYFSQVLLIVIERLQSYSAWQQLAHSVLDSASLGFRVPADTVIVKSSEGDIEVRAY